MQFSKDGIDSVTRLEGRLPHHSPHFLPHWQHGRHGHAFPRKAGPNRPNPLSSPPLLSCHPTHTPLMLCCELLRQFPTFRRGQHIMPLQHAHPSCPSHHQTRSSQMPSILRTPLPNFRKLLKPPTHLPVGSSATSSMRHRHFYPLCSGAQTHQ